MGKNETRQKYLSYSSDPTGFISAKTIVEKDILSYVTLILDRPQKELL